MGKTLLIVASLIVSGGAFAQVGWEKYMDQGDRYVSEEIFDKALGAYARAIKKSKLADETSYKLLYKRALCYYQLAMYSEALHDTGEFLSKIPGDEKGLLLRALINRETDNAEQQLADLSALLTTNAGNSDLMKWKASLLIDKHQYADAFEILSAIPPTEVDPEAELYFGLIDYYLGNLAAAITHFDKAINIQPDYEAPYLYAVSLALDEEVYDLALDYIAKAEKIFPGNLTLVFYKGIALVENKKIDEGCRCLAKAFYGGLDDAADYLTGYCYESQD